jgi:tetratricopeptide (TPR) repeat protein
MKSKRIPKVKPEKRVAVTSRRRWQLVLLACVALCALVLAAYWDSLDNGFVWDDHEQVVMNPYLKPDAAWGTLFTADVRFSRQDQAESTKVYRPLQLVTYRLVSGWADGGATAFHASSVAFAMAAALAAFWVFWLLTRQAGVAFAGAALFAVHPVHTEAVDWIAALPDLGVGLFVLLAFGLFCWRSRASLGLSLAAFGVALLWKETAVVFPLMIASYVWATESGEGSRPRRALMASGPYWALLAVYLAVRAAVLGGLAVGGRDWALPPVQSALTMAQLMLSYWGKLALPIGLNAYHVFHPVRSAGEAGGWLALVVLIAGLSGIAWLVRRAPLYGFAALWVLLFLLPAMNFSGLGRNPFAERYLYLPSAGFCLLLAMTAAWLLQRLPARSQAFAGMGLLAVTLAICVADTSVRNLAWRDDATLWRETLPLSPDAPFVRLMVASAAGTDLNAAEQDYRKAIDLAQQQTPPDRLYTLKGYEGLASLYAERGLFDKAMDALTQARTLAPNDPDVAAEEGLILARVGRAGGSEDALKRALAAHPNNENLIAALGLIARDEHHDLKRAAELFAKALAVHAQQDDFSASQHNNLAAVYGDQENYAGAIAELREAIRILPTDPEFHVNLASALAATGRFDEARAEAEEALKIAPNDPNAQDVLARLNQVR